MSDSNGPVRRRRIAGETKPAAPAKKAAAKKVAGKKAAPAKKATPTKKSTAKVAPAATKAPSKAAAPVKKPSPAKKAAPTARTTPVTRSVSTATVTRPVTPAPSTRVAADEVKAPRSRKLIAAVVGATAVLVAGILLLVLGLTGSNGSGGDAFDSSREQASAAAGTAAETIFSFKYNELDQHLSASKALMTPSFSKDFDAIAPALTDLAPKRKIVVEAVARDAAPLACGDECSDTKVNVLVFVDQARLVGGSDEPTVFANRISMSMVKSDDGWLVNDIRAL